MALRARGAAAPEDLDQPARRGFPSRGLYLWLVLVGALCFISTACAHEQVHLYATFSPDRLNTSTTISFGLAVSTSDGTVPSPLEELQLFLPAGLGLATSTLGLANCDPSALLEKGLGGCSANAHMGFGTAEAVVPISPERVIEKATITALAGRPNPERLEMLFYAEAYSPVAAQLVFPGRMEIGAPKGLYSGDLDTTVPLVPTWPGGPDVSLTRLRSTIGPAGLTYTRRLHGRTIHFHPRGITIPGSCPRGGFPLAGIFSFLDGSSVRTKTSIPCPRARRRHKA